MTDNTENQLATTRPPAQGLAQLMPRRELNFFSDIADYEAGGRMAMMLSKASIVPTLYQDHPSNCFIALELSNRLGVSPLTVMQQVDIIHGRPSLRGTFLVGLVNGSGLYTTLKYECNNLAGDDFGWRAWAKEKATEEICVGPWITWRMVKGEGWDSKSGSKWKTMPELMFQYRAASFWSRLFASHITLGLYESDEARDIWGYDEPTAQLTGPRPSNGGGLSAIAELGAELAAATAAQAATQGPVVPEAVADDQPAPEAAKPRQRRAAAAKADAPVEPEATTPAPVASAAAAAADFNLE